MRSPTGRRRAGVLAATALAAVALTGCGGSGGAGGAGGASPAPSASTTGQDGVRWARCMREHGVDVADPSGDGQVRVTADGKDAAALEAATQACTKYAPKPDLDPARQQQVQQQALAFARCMREHGIDVPDPQAKGDGSVVIGKPGQGGAMPDLQSPAFRAAQEACATHLPKPPGGQP